VLFEAKHGWVGTGAPLLVDGDAVLSVTHSAKPILGLSLLARVRLLIRHSPCCGCQLRSILGMPSRRCDDLGNAGVMGAGAAGARASPCLLWRCDGGRGGLTGQPLCSTPTQACHQRRRGKRISRGCATGFYGVGFFYPE
jgi:hypothetical protein